MSGSIVQIVEKTKAANRILRALPISDPMHESEETRLRRDQEARDRCQDAKSTGRAFGHVSCFVRESSTSWVLPHMAIHGVLFWLPTTFTNFLLSLYVIVIPIAYSFMFLWYFWFWKFWFQRLLCGASAFPWLTWFRGCYGPHAFGNFVSFLGARGPWFLLPFTVYASRRT